MSTLTLLVVALFQFVHAETDNVVRIINGVPTSASQYPWIVSLREVRKSNVTGIESHTFCTASLIRLLPPVIVTAAHCWYKKTMLWYIRESDLFGDGSWTVMGNYVGDRTYYYADINRTYVNQNLTSAPTQSFQTLRIYLKNIYIHEKYHAWGAADIANDLALIIFEDDKHVFDTNAVTLPTLFHTDPLELNQPLKALGYGVVRNTVHSGPFGYVSDVPSYTLRSAELYYIDYYKATISFIFIIILVLRFNANIYRIYFFFFF
eukprot:673411_1